MSAFVSEQLHRPGATPPTPMAFHFKHRITTMADLLPKTARRGVLMFYALAIVLGCGTETGGGWSCDITLTWNGKTATGSGTGDTQSEAEDAALRVACPKLGVSGDQLSRCQQGLPLGGDWSSKHDCETT